MTTNSVGIRKFQFELVETQSVPPADLRPEVEELIQKARKLRTKVKNIRGEIPLRLDALWRELTQLRVKIRRYTEEEEKRYSE